MEIISSDTSQLGVRKSERSLPTRRWSLAAIRRLSVSKRGSKFRLEAEEGVVKHGVIYNTTTTSDRPRSVVRRALHKIGKKKRKHNAVPIIDVDPPNVEELDVDPRLREKWEKRRELRRQAAAQGDEGEKQLISINKSKGMAALVINGLSTGSAQWLKDKTRRWVETNRIALAAVVAVVGFALVCAIVVRRCS